MNDTSDEEGAPGRLRLVEELLNTYDVASSRDEIATPAGAARWLEERGLLQSGRVTRAGVEDLVALREALRALALANNGEALDAGAVATLNRLATTSPLVVTSDAAGGLSMQPTAGGVRGAIGELLAIVHAASADGSWARSRHAAATPAGGASTTVPATDQVRGATWPCAGTGPRSRRTGGVTDRTVPPSQRARAAATGDDAGSGQTTRVRTAPSPARRCRRAGRRS